MLVYQLMPAHFALEDLKKRRIKVSLLDDLNDPFELLGASLHSKGHRTQMKKWASYMASISRMLCFSKDFSNPVLWSHYADKHRGICLEFEIPDSYLSHVNYSSSRLQIDFHHEFEQQALAGPPVALALLTTKFIDWQYENEVRMFLKPDEVICDGAHQFYSFCNCLKLKKVYLGPRCKVTKIDVQKVLNDVDREVVVLETRLAFRSYKVIPTPFNMR